MEAFFKGEVLSLLLLSLFRAIEPLIAAGEGNLSDPPLPDPWVPGCIRAWETAWCATSAGIEVALLMALAILRLCGTVKEPNVAPSVSGPPSDAACEQHHDR